MEHRALGIGGAYSRVIEKPAGSPDPIVSSGPLSPHSHQHDICGRGCPPRYDKNGRDMRWPEGEAARSMRLRRERLGRIERS